MVKCHLQLKKRLWRGGEAGKRQTSRDNTLQWGVMDEIGVCIWSVCVLHVECIWYSNYMEYTDGVDGGILFYSVPVHTIFPFHGYRKYTHKL